MNLWAAQWRSENKLDGKREHVMYVDCLPKLFRTRREAVEWIKATHGYIATRSDLRAEPHGWKMPKPIRVKLEPIA